MKTPLVATLLAALPAVAQTGFPAIHPAMMFTPAMGHPLGMMAPAPFHPLRPVAPLGIGTPLLGGLVHPAMQMAPNLLSHRHLHYMTNPYLGGPAAGNPYLKPALPNPFAPPGFAPALPSGGFNPPALTLPLPFANPAIAPYGVPTTLRRP
jgi:hypothetical protein